MKPPAIAYVGLGANRGEMRLNLPQAAQRLATLPETRLLACSRLYRTPAWGVEDQDDFLNAVAAVETGLSPRALLDGLLAIEREFGRDREREQRWGPRTMDLDLLLYGREQVDEPGLRVPHPHLHERAFALLPLLEIAPEIEIPGQGAARDAVSALDLSNIQPLSGDNAAL